MFTNNITTDIQLKLLEHRESTSLFQLIDQSREHLREWLPWVDFTNTVEDSKSFIQSTLQQFMNNDGFQAGIWYKGQLAGVIGLHSINWSNRSTSIGYWLGENFQGKGIMVNTCKAVVHYCLNELQLHRVEIRVATRNVKSQVIPEKLGFKKEGCLREVERIHNQYVDHFVYGVLKKDWPCHHNGLQEHSLT